MERVRVGLGVAIACASTAAIVDGEAGVASLGRQVFARMPWFLIAAGVILLLNPLGPPRRLVVATVVGGSGTLLLANRSQLAHDQIIAALPLLGLVGGVAMALFDKTASEVGPARRRIWSMLFLSRYRYLDAPARLTVTSVLFGSVHLDLRAAGFPRAVKELHLFIRLWVAREVVLYVPRQWFVVVGDCSAAYAINWVGSFDVKETYAEIEEQQRRSGVADPDATSGRIAARLVGLVRSLRVVGHRLVGSPKPNDPSVGALGGERRNYLVLNVLGLVGTVRIERDM